MIKKKSICKECNSSKVRCEYCSTNFSFSRLKGHIRRFLEDIVLPRGVDSIWETASQINGIKHDNELIKSEFLEDQGTSFADKSNSAPASIDNSNSTF